MKTVIEMAREAAAKHGHTLKDVPEQATLEFIEALVELARADAIADEREACAKVCERTKGLDRSGWPQHYEAHELAAAIRARSKI